MGIVVDTVLPIAIAFIMFSLGLGLKPADFFHVVRHPRDFFVGMTSQIVFLPVVAFLLVLIWPLPPDLALGVMILAAAPGGATSNLLTAFARGDVALSVSLTAVTSLLCVLTVPPIVFFSHAYLLGGNLPGPPSLGGIALKLFAMVTIPVLMGVVLRLFAEQSAIRLEPLAFKAATLIFILVLAAAIYKERSNLPTYFAQSGSVTLALNIVMMSLAFALAQVFASSPRQRAAISIECGIQGGAVAIAVSALLFGGGLTLVPAVTYSLTMYWTAFALIAYFRLGPLRNAEP